MVITSPVGAVAKYCDERVCLVMCLSVCEDISWTTRAIFTNFSMHVAYDRCSVLLWQGDEIPRRRSSFGVFPTDSALYSRAFGTHTETAEAIEMPFGMITRVGRRYHVLDGGADPQRDRHLHLTQAILGECKKQNNVTAEFGAKGIIQSPITYCSRKDHSVCQASANRGDAAYRPGRRWWECTAWVKYDIYDCLVNAWTFFVASNCCWLLSWSVRFITTDNWCHLHRWCPCRAPGL